MSEYQVETRRRSRSKTPFLRSSCDHETCEHAGEEGHVHHHHQHPKKKAPNVQTIIEEAVRSIIEDGSQMQTQNTQRTKTSDYSSEDNSPESKLKKSQEAHSSSAMTSSSTTTTTTIITKNKRLGGATSTPKTSYLAHSFASQFSTTGTESTSAQRLKEVTQNVLNAEQERSQRSAQNNSSFMQRSLSRLIGPNISTQAQASDDSINGDMNDHLAYMEYKKAGEYWNKTPKTDYTYSELSPHRRELAPGVVAMPNMSRCSLENHHERINYMIERNPAQEEFIRRRYESSRYVQNRQAAEKLAYDSGDELDYTQFESNRKNQYFYSTKESWFTRFITTIVTTVTSAWSSVTGGNVAGRYDHSALYYTKYGKVERGLWGSIGHRIASVFTGLFRYIYLFISSVLCFDTWLLQSSNAENKSKKRFLLFLLMLLPLLLLGAWYLLGEDERAYYLQQTRALVPLSLLASWQTSLYAASTSLKDRLQLVPSYISSLTSHYSGSGAAHLHIHHIEQNLQKSLTPEEYENILNHVNSYVQKLIDLKLEAQQAEHSKQTQNLSPAQIQLIVQLMRENLESFMRDKHSEGSGKLGDLSEADLLRLVELIRVRLEADGWASRPVKLSPENLTEIKRLITEQIKVENHAHYTLLVEQLDLDALLMRLLGAPQLARYIDGHIANALDGKLLSLKAGSGDRGSIATMDEEQRTLINELNNEIAFIKLALSNKESENDDLHQSISKLRVNQDDLLKRLQEHELSTDQRFSGLLKEIDAKLLQLNDAQFKLLNKQIKLSLVEILGFKNASPNGVKLEDVDLQNWVRNMFVAKDYLEQRLLELNAGTDSKIKEEIDRSGMLLMRDISERLKREILLSVELKYNASAEALKGQINSALSEEEVRKIVKSVLAIYDADKTGLVDFALESAGGQILSTRCTESYQTKSAQISIFGIPLWYPTNTPRVAISPNVQPGECWAFRGFPGFLVLKLNSLVYVTGFTLEHIPKALAPNGRIDSAPKNFTVWGLEHEKDQEPVLFGEYEYADNDASLQYFPVQNNNIKRPYEIVELRIETNHGHEQYTCLYRFRVHGKPPAA